MKLILKKILVAILSTVILSIILSLLGYTPIKNQLDDMEYMSFSGLFILFSIYLSFIYLIIGIPLSYFIDFKIKKTIFNLIGYLISGAIVGGLFFAIFSPSIHIPELLTYMGVGSFASLLFWLQQKLIKKN